MIEGLGLELKSGVLSDKVPAKCYSGRLGASEVHVVTNGQCERYKVDEVGTAAASLTAWLALDALKPDILVNAGTAGGFKRKGAKIGDVYISSEVAHHDRRIEIPGFKEWGVGQHTTHYTPRLREALGYKHGNVSTSNSLDASDTDHKLMLEERCFA